MPRVADRRPEEHEITARQHGVISAAQLRAAGHSKGAIAHRARTGRLRRLHHGVYLAGPVAGPLAREWAAILACGPRAVLSHDTALWIERLGSRPGEVHVTVPSQGADHAGVRKHVGEVESRLRHGLPVTLPARTLLDLAASTPAVHLARVVEEALLQRLVTRQELQAARRPGAPALRAAVGDDEPRLTRSEAERRLLRLIRDAKLPAPQTNVRVGRHEVDLLWPDVKLIIEVDGFAFHSSRRAFERDRVRDAELLALGYRVLRITWRRIVDEPLAVIALLSAARSA